MVEYDSPLVLQAGAQRLFEVQATALGELFQGERSEIRTTGRKPGTPVSWIDDPQNSDDIKVVVNNREVIGDTATGSGPLLEGGRELRCLQRVLALATAAGQDLFVTRPDFGQMAREGELPRPWI